ncbi:hypothetical protein P879_11566 [Paragonimus westermani]|uniref:Uncharacterized protein n=1 Tax=Paragonimus westermani TaxID=34504 RepID=A0A8T0D6Z6_9TREM|nr:hypothetical protein P879_11566 [Paragonimus westermani]
MYKLSEKCPLLLHGCEVLRYMSSMDRVGRVHIRVTLNETYMLEYGDWSRNIPFLPHHMWYLCSQCLGIAATWDLWISSSYNLANNEELEMNLFELPNDSE